MDNLDAQLSNADVNQTVVLQKINEALAALGSKDKWLKAPEQLPEYEALKGKRIVLVEDVKGVIENLLPEYISATEGNAEAVFHTTQDLEGLVAEIISKDPDVVLMDYSLAKNITGVEVIEGLREQGFTGKIVGNSSESHRAEEFKRAGAIGSIDKSSYPTSDSIIELAKLLS